MMIPGIVAAQRVVAPTEQDNAFFVGASASTQVNQFTRSCVKPAGTQPGDLILLIGHIPYPGSHYNVSTPAGFVSIAQLLNVQGRFSVFSRIASGAEGATFTLSDEYGAPISFLCCVYRGVTSINVMPAEPSTSSMASSITPTLKGVLLALFSCEANTTDVNGHTPPGGMAMAAQNHIAGSHIVADHLLSSPAGATGTKTVVWSPITNPLEPSAALIQLA